MKNFAFQNVPCMKLMVCLVTIEMFMRLISAPQNWTVPLWTWSLQAAALRPQSLGRREKRMKVSEGVIIFSGLVTN